MPSQPIALQVLAEFPELATLVERWHLLSERERIGATADLRSEEVLCH
jgi:hypothetical protein